MLERSTSTSAAARRPLSVAEYHRLINIGVYTKYDRVELIEGFLVPMSPHSPRNSRIVQYLTDLLVRAVGRRYRVRCQLPLTFVRSEPEPDFAIVPARPRADEEVAHPTSAPLVIEVSWRSLTKDHRKAAIYAAAGIEEYWIIDLRYDCIEVRRDPSRRGRRYRDVSTVRSGTLRSIAVPAVVVSLAKVFPRRPARR